MTELVFTGSQPFEIILQRDSTTVAEGESVATVLPVFAPGFPGNVAQIRLVLNIDQASQLASELQTATVRARQYAGRF